MFSFTGFKMNCEGPIGIFTTLKIVGASTPSLGQEWLSCSRGLGRVRESKHI